ncbi:uncharacterized protein [Apostichopus japonicus]|uniref:uncharacterized protein n=1 Tax=Stichopus japonicus TaxID=307972 RepID=UPI003AB81C8E
MRCVVHTSAGSDVFNENFHKKFVSNIQEWFNVDHEVTVWIRTDLRLFRDCSSSPCGYLEVFGFEKLEDEAYTRKLHKQISQFISKETSVPEERFFVIFRKVWGTNYSLPNGSLLSE